MDKPIKVKLEKNQMVVTEKQYAVAVHFIKVGTMDNTLGGKTIRATSADEALGMVLRGMEARFKTGWIAANFLVLETGE